jgi:hypothetical protein
MAKRREESDGRTVPDGRRKAVQTVAVGRGGKATTVYQQAGQLGWLFETADSPKGDVAGMDGGRPPSAPRAVPKSRSLQEPAMTRVVGAEPLSSGELGARSRVLRETRPRLIEGEMEAAPHRSHRPGSAHAGAGIVKVVTSARKYCGMQAPENDPMVELRTRPAIERAGGGHPPPTGPVYGSPGPQNLRAPKSRMCGPQVRFCERGPWATRGLYSAGRAARRRTAPSTDQGWATSSLSPGASSSGAVPALLLLVP